MADLHPVISRILREAGIDETQLKQRGHVLTHGKAKYFTRTSKDVKQMRGEIESLKAMATTCPEVVPVIIGYSLDGPTGGMVTQYFELGSPGSSREAQRELARRIAKMHTPPDNCEDRYGFHVPTHCGATEQDNTWEDSWESFYTETRLGDLVRRIGDKRLTGKWDDFKTSVLPLVLRDITPPPRPVILHGDLWSGNKGFDTLTSQPVIYDPSSYYGHNEADLGIMHMFGGFSDDFFDEYHSIHPRSAPYYEERAKVYELYHHLNHALMFGGGYLSGSLRIMESLLLWSRTIAASRT